MQGRLNRIPWPQVDTLANRGSVQWHSTPVPSIPLQVLLCFVVMRAFNIGWDRHHRQPVAIFFSAAYLAAASFTIGAITESSETYQSEVIFQFSPSQVWMRPVWAPSWSAQATLIGRSTPSKPSCLIRSAEMSRFSYPQRTCSPVRGLLPNFACAVRIASTPSMEVINPRT